MKKIMMMLAAICVAVSMFAKDNVATVVFNVNPQMHCENCEKKIKSNLRFEKGVKGVETSVADQTVTVTYDPAKTTPEALAKSFAKINYSATACAAPAKAAKACTKTLEKKCNAQCGKKGHKCDKGSCDNKAHQCDKGSCDKGSCDNKANKCDNKLGKCHKK